MRGSEYAELAAFVAVARERSFRAAAARLGLSRSALSHSIRDLEGRVGTKLLNRTTRSVSPTEAGRSLFARVEPAFAEIAAGVNALSEFRDRPSGTVRLNLPRTAAQLLTPVLSRFIHANPDVQLELTIDDALSDVVAGGYDAGIRLGERLQRDMVAVRITPDLRVAVVGSPRYFSDRERPLTPRDLQDHNCLTYRWAGTGALYNWSFEKEGERLNVNVNGPLTLNDAELIIALALDGTGLACAIDDLVLPHLQSGRLVRVLEDWCPLFPGFFLYFADRRQLPSAVRALFDFLQVRGRSTTGPDEA